MPNRVCKNEITFYYSISQLPLKPNSIEKSSDFNFFQLMSVRLFADEIGPTKEIYYDNNTETYLAKDISS
jgi:hypothetical protein